MSSLQSGNGLNANLENFELTDVVQLITQQTKSGILSVAGNDGTCSWSFDKGTLVDFSCNFNGGILNLKDILEHSKIIDKSYLIALYNNDNQVFTHTLEEALVKDNIIDRDELERINLRRLIESFIITLQWTRGSYKLIPTEKVKKHPFLRPQDANFIILEALRQIDEMVAIKKRLQPLDQIYETTLATDKNNSKKGDSFFTEGLNEQFDWGELEVYQLLDGKRPLQEIIELSITGQYHTCRTISDFLNRNIITSTTNETTYHFRKIPSSSQKQHMVAIALLILSGALLISAFITVKPVNSNSSNHPTLFSAIIDNLKADQKAMQRQAYNLLQKDKQHDE